MNLYGIALLPEEEWMKKIIQFQNSELDFFQKPKLSLDGFLPHTSILQCPFYRDKLTFETLETIAQSWREIGENKSSFGDLYYQPKGWFFLGVRKATWLEYAQSSFLRMVEDFIDESQIEPSKRMQSYSEGERENFLRYGYRYVGDEFRPHITMGHDEECVRPIPDSLISCADGLFNNQEFMYDRVAFYKAGADGALAEILCEINFSE